MVATVSLPCFPNDLLLETSLVAHLSMFWCAAGDVDHGPVAGYTCSALPHGY